jgi:hypothetical protein
MLNAKCCYAMKHSTLKIQDSTLKKTISKAINFIDNITGVVISTKFKLSIIFYQNHINQ